MDSTIHSQEFGEGLPILIVPGWQMDGAAEAIDFEPIFSKLPAPGLRRIYVDLPGMGKTPANGVQSLDDMYARLTQFIDTRLGKSRFLLAGSSCGGYFARALTLQYSDQVDGLLLRVPVIEPETEKRDLDAFEPVVRDEQVMSDLPAEDRTLLGDVLVQTPSYTQLLKAKWDQAYLQAEEAADTAVLDPIRADPTRYRLSVSLDHPDQQRFPAPTLVVCGRQDVEVGYRDALRLLGLYPRSTLAVLDRASHDLPVDQGGLFEALVRDWVERVHEWRGRIET